MESISRRTSAALKTRRSVVEAAHMAFLERGYSATTIKDIAERAGVSQETIYKGFGSKANLLKAAYDVAMAGDHDQAPIASRPEGRAALEATTPVAAAAAYADLAELLMTRAAPLTRIVLASRGASDEVEDFAAAIDTERLKGQRPRPSGAGRTVAGYAPVWTSTKPGTSCGCSPHPTCTR